MNHEDEGPPKSGGVFSEGGARINAEDGYVIIVRRDRATQLTTLEVEDSKGVVVACRVLGGEDVERLRNVLVNAWNHAREFGVPVTLDVSAVIGRD